MIGTTDESKLNNLWGLAFDQCGNLHVADSNTNMSVHSSGSVCHSVQQGVNNPAGSYCD